MKKYLLLLTLIISTFAGANAQAYECCTMPCCENPCCYDGSQFYVSAYGAANWLNAHKRHHVSSHFDVGFTGALALGYKFNPLLRAEAEVAYRTNKLDHVKCYGEKFRPSGYTDSCSIMLNGLWDIDLNQCFTPYLGLGVGYSFLNAKVSHHHVSASGNCNGVAGQAIVGVSTRVWCNTDLGIEYRYFLARSNYHEQSLGLSLRYGF